MCQLPAMPFSNTRHIMMINHLSMYYQIMTVFSNSLESLGPDKWLLLFYGMLDIKLSPGVAMGNFYNISCINCWLRTSTYKERIFLIVIALVKWFASFIQNNRNVLWVIMFISVASNSSPGFCPNSLSRMSCCAHPTLSSPVSSISQGW